MALNILRVDSSIRTDDSHSRKLTDKLIKQLSANEEVMVTTRDVAQGVTFIDGEWGKANFTAIDERSQRQAECLRESDVYVAELMAADVIVLGLPVYNFSLAASFKAWIDQVVRSKVTFRYGDKGPIGLVENTKAYLVVTSGGSKLGSELDFISAYLRHILGFMGITDVTFIDGSGVGKDEAAVLSRCHTLIEQM